MLRNLFVIFIFHKTAQHSSFYRDHTMLRTFYMTARIFSALRIVKVLTFAHHAVEVTESHKGYLYLQLVDDEYRCVHRLVFHNAFHLCLHTFQRATALVENNSNLVHRLLFNYMPSRKHIAVFIREWTHQYSAAFIHSYRHRSQFVLRHHSSVLLILSIMSG